MKWIKNIQRTDWLLIGIYYGLALMIEVPALLIEEKATLFSAEGIQIFGFKFSDYLLDISVELVVVFVIFSRFFFQRKYVQTLLLCIVLLTTQVFIQPIIFPESYIAQIPFRTEYFLNQLSNNVQAITGVCFILIAKQFYEIKSQVMELEKEKKETELRWLKAQIDPHFLFNNLNILDILINTNPSKASIYTKRLSSLYRYLIRHKEEDNVVQLAQEWHFSQDYIYLLQQRFDALFVFNDRLDDYSLNNYFIPPASMQIMLENIVKHNMALPGQPIVVDIYIEDHYLCVKNDLRKKKNVKDSTGTGLNNLQKRIELLSDRKVIIEQEDQHFLVKVPLVQQVV